MHLQCRFSVAFLWLVLTSTLLTFGCTGATYIRATVNDNPLDRVAQQAQKEWTVQRVDENTLRLRDVWPIFSVASFGYTASYANIIYNPSVHEIDLQYYLRFQSLLYLFIPIYNNAEPNINGVSSPIMEGQINDILTWSGATQKFRRSGSESEPFPPYVNSPPAAKK